MISEMGFRLVLLFVGCVVILAIYLWGRYSSAKSRDLNHYVSVDSQKTPGLSIRTDDVELQDLTDTIQDLREENLSMQLNEKNGEVLTKLSTRDSSTSDDVNEPNKENPPTANSKDSQQQEPAKHHFILLIKAKPGVEFTGLDILSITKSCGMKFSNTGVFHHYGDQNHGTEQPLFSLANLYEPGEFDLITLDKLCTHGLLLFMPLPCPLDARIAMDIMYSAAQKFAGELDGDVFDQKKNPVTDKVIGDYVNYINHHS